MLKKTNQLLLLAIFMNVWCLHAESENGICKIDIGIIMERNLLLDCIGPSNVLDRVFNYVKPSFEGNRTSVAILCSNSTVLYRFKDSQSYDSTLAKDTLKKYLEENKDGLKADSKNPSISTDQIDDNKNDCKLDSGNSKNVDCDFNSIELASSIMFSPNYRVDGEISRYSPKTRRAIIIFGQVGNSNIILNNENKNNTFVKDSLHYYVIQINKTDSVSPYMVNWYRDDAYFKIKSLDQIDTVLTNIISHVCESPGHSSNIENSVMNSDSATNESSSDSKDSQDKNDNGRLQLHTSPVVSSKPMNDNMLGIIDQLFDMATSQNVNNGFDIHSNPNIVGEYYPPDRFVELTDLPKTDSYTDPICKCARLSKFKGFKYFLTKNDICYATNTQSSDYNEENQSNLVINPYLESSQTANNNYGNETLQHTCRELNDETLHLCKESKYETLHICKVE